MKNHIEVIATDVDDLAMMGFGSVENCKSVFMCLKKDYPNTNFNIVRNKHDLEVIVLKKPDLVFSGIKYIPLDKTESSKTLQKKIWISEYMEKSNINYVGSSKKSIELEFDKSLAKKEVLKYGINTAPYFVAFPNSYKNSLPLSFPLFIKPLCEGDGKGIDDESIVYDYISYQKKVDYIYELYRQPSLVEKFIQGREFTVSILEQSSGNYLLMPIEIFVDNKNSNNRILGYDVKKENIERTSLVINQKIFDKIALLAKKSFIALGARDYGRIDIIMDNNNSPFFLEANLVPGMTQRIDSNNSSYFPRACFLNNNLNYQEVVTNIVKIALNRTKNNQVYMI
jgi:D-alanine-D-alanine ligase